ncbi:MAG: type III secretion T3S chaperone [Chlamydiota bacterium]
MREKNYPLEQVILIKQKRLEEAEKVLQQKKELLVKEEQKMKTVEQERDLVKHHKDDKLTQLRHELDTGTSSLKIQQMRLYLKEVEEKLKAKELKVKEQQKLLEAAIKAVEVARDDMLKKRQSTEKMDMHKEEWKKEQKVFEVQEEAAEADEIGTTIFTKRKPHG